MGEGMVDQKTSLWTLRSVIDRTSQGGSKRLQKLLENDSRLVPRDGEVNLEKTTFMREPLDVGLKLATIPRFLATGNSYPSLQYSFRV